MHGRLGGKLLLIGASVLVTLLGLEVGIGMFRPQVTFSHITVFYPFGCFKKGDYYWIGLMPSKHCTLSAANNAFPPHTVDINSLGLRNREITLPKPTGTTRVLFVGDSFFFGLGVEEKDGVVRRTEDLFNQSSGYKIETVNAGLPASGPSYYYLFLKNEGFPLDPDVLVVGLYFRNDITENILNSRWVEENEEGLPEKVDSNIYSIDAMTHNLFPHDLPLKYRIPFLRNFHLFTLIADRIAPPLRDTKKFISYQICFYKDSCRDLDQAKAKTKQLFAAIKRLTDSRGAKLLVIFIPTELQFSNSVDYVRTEIPVPLSPKEKERPYTEFFQYFRQHDIEYLDLRPVFIKSGHPLDGYFSLDRHWNAYGNEIAAEAISQKLQTMLSP